LRTVRKYEELDLEYQRGLYEFASVLINIGEKSINPALDILRKISGVSGTFIAVSVNGLGYDKRCGSRLMRKFYESYASTRRAVFAGNPVLTDSTFREAGLQRWERKLSEGETVYVRAGEVSGRESALFSSMNLGSVAGTPINSNSGWIGTVGFVWDKEECVISDQQVVLLETSAKLLSSFFSALYYEKSLKEKYESLSNALIVNGKIVSILGHDLRNPLSSIIGFMNLLMNREDNSSISEEDSYGYMKIILDSANAMSELIEEVIYWSKSVSQDLKPHRMPIHASEVVDECFHLISAGAREKGITLENKVDADLIINADMQMLSIILRNMVTNSVKFTFKGGRVSVSARKEGKFVRFHVKDNGTGMDGKTIDDLMKGNVITSSQGTGGELGSGLGLITCKEFIEKHNGMLSINSSPGKGTDMSFTIDCSERSAHE
jgi:signal transduction histidine kinase